MSDTKKGILDTQTHQMDNIKAVIWDYNGTLLDDLDISIKAINNMLTKRNLKTLNTHTYKELFTFPVKKYYESIGFDFEKENWDNVAKEFISLYTKFLPESIIFPDAIKCLEQFKLQGKKQFILSAMEHSMLTKSAGEMNISQHFEEISGIDNIYASSKIDNGLKLIKKHNLNPEEVCLLGDTTHDYEVANKLNCKCILITKGHQSLQRLNKNTQARIINNLDILL